MGLKVPENIPKRNGSVPLCPKGQAPERLATITCPLCGTQAWETMPENACQRFYLCIGCGEMLKPKDGDCCVFCSYSDTVCPPEQTA
jgi:hypothetical protein